LQIVDITPEYMPLPGIANTVVISRHGHA